MGLSQVIIHILVAFPLTKHPAIGVPRFMETAIFFYLLNTTHMAMDQYLQIFIHRSQLVVAVHYKVVPQSQLSWFITPISLWFMGRHTDTILVVINQLITGGGTNFLWVFLWFLHFVGSQNPAESLFFWFNHHFPMVFPWFSYGFPMVFLGLQGFDPQPHGSCSGPRHRCLCLRARRGALIRAPRRRCQGPNRVTTADPGILVRLQGLTIY